jgi:hypothetical protein
MTSEGLGEVLNGDSADRCVGIFPLVLLGGGANGQVCADCELGCLSARAEICLKSQKYFVRTTCPRYKNVKIFQKHLDVKNSLME